VTFKVLKAEHPSRKYVSNKKIYKFFFYNIFIYDFVDITIYPQMLNKFIANTLLTCRKSYKMNLLKKLEYTI